MADLSQFSTTQKANQDGVNPPMNRLTVHDLRALNRFGETAGWLGIEFADYLVLGVGEEPAQPASPNGATADEHKG